MRKGVHINSAIQGTLPPPIPFIGISAFIDQVRSEIEASIENRCEQRADVVRIAGIQIGSGLRQRSRALETAFARGEVKSSQSTGRPVNGARLRRDLPVEVVDVRSGI